MEDKIKILEIIATDMKNDAEEFDGKPFNGKTVAEYFGRHGAAIATSANIMKSIIEQIEKERDVCVVCGDTITPCCSNCNRVDGT